MSNELTYAQASKRLKELQYAKAQMGQLSINDEVHKKALEIALPILEQQERGEEEWIDWGGECPPLHPGQIVEIKTVGDGTGGGPAGMAPWSIVTAYRIIPERATNQNGEAS